MSYSQATLTWQALRESPDSIEVTLKMANALLSLSSLSAAAHICRNNASASRTASITGSRGLRASLRAAEVFEPGPTVSTSGVVPTHRVTVHDRQRGVTHEFVVPEV